VLLGGLLMLVAVVVAMFFAIEESGGLSNYPYFFLLPWIVGLAIVLVTPSAILFYKGKFTLSNPIVWATWTYLFPAFVMGGFFMAGGWSQPYYLSFIQDAEYTLPLTISLVALGFIGLSIGYFLPLGSRVGGLLERMLPATDYSTKAYYLPSFLLFVLGIFNTSFAFIMGLFGFQRAQEFGTYDGIVYLTTLFWVQGSFLLWSIVFRQEKLKPIHFLTIAFLIVTALGRSIFSGTRGGLVTACFTVVLAYVLSGKAFRIRHYILAGCIFFSVLMAGMIYGSTFRAVKGSEERQNIDQYAENVLQTIDQVGQSDVGGMFDYGFSRITERMDVVSGLAVVVSNHERLEPYEEAYGINDNIWTDLTTFFIPRVIWTDKPAASDARRFSDLYFEFGESSTAITPFGDLLRNYGIPGVFVGMFALGLILRTLHRMLIENQSPRLWRSALWFMVLMSVSFEGFYGTIIPFLFKDGVTAVIGISIVCLLAAKLMGGDRSEGALLKRPLLG